MRTSQFATLRRMYANGASYMDMSAATGVSMGGIAFYITQHRDEFPYRKHHIDWWREHLQGLEGLSSRDAAEVLGVTHKAVCHWRNRIGKEQHGGD